MIFKNNYKKLLQLLPDLGTENFESRKLKAEGFMDLNVDLLMSEKHRILLALSHYFKHPSGDLIADPDMEVAVYPDRQVAEALSYQDMFGYSVVYPEEGKVDLSAKKELNSFLGQWLSNLKAQGHRQED